MTHLSNTARAFFPRFKTKPLFTVIAALALTLPVLASAQQATARTATGGVFIAGDRVFDTITGQEGDVERATGFGSAQLHVAEHQLRALRLGRRRK